MPLPLSQYEESIYSQFGEDGVINYLVTSLLDLGVDMSFRCCEFGAWDGKHLSNTMNLILNWNFQGILIEADKDKYEDLLINTSELDVLALNEFVTPEGNTLEEIFQRNSISNEVDVLSIDIDGSDFQILGSLERLRPKILVIEYNPSIPLDFEYINPVGFSKGSSAASLVILAKEKGYALVHRTSVNLIFIQQEIIQNQVFAMEISATTPIDMDLEIPRVFFGYDGTIQFTTKNLKLPWHAIQIDESEFQVLPSYLLKVPTQYNNIENILYFIRVFGWKNFVKRIILRILKRV